MSQPIPRIKTHIAGLDDKLLGGMPEGFNIVLWGPVGTLKSSIAFSILYRNAQEGKSGVYFSLEQTSSSLLQQASTMNMDISGLGDKLTVLDIGSLRRATEAGPLDQGPSIDWSDVVLNQMKVLRSRGKMDIVVIDSLNILAMFSERDVVRKEMFHMFRELKDMGLTAILIVEGSEEHINAENHVFKYLADGLISLSIERKDRSTTRLLQVVKMRSTNHSTDLYPLLFDRDRFKIITK